MMESNSVEFYHLIYCGFKYPFGEMLVGSGNVHGFTGKELDAESGLNYFCQRYYDSQIGRFMTLDTRTHLPDDERLFSYEKYLRWDNYTLTYSPQAAKNNLKVFPNREPRISSYDTLTKEITLLFPVNVVFGDSVILGVQMRNKSSILKYYKITEKYQNQLNGYRYCWNNPVRYTDSTGNWGAVLDYLLRNVGLGIALYIRLNQLYNTLEPGYGYRFDLGLGYALWFYKDYEGYRCIYLEVPGPHWD